ncbi:MAG: hypothetical protein NUW37_15140 [Planctomycetes bacterium]|nr:hypothetical protein [Planctomycetota bacterium]
MRKVATLALGLFVLALGFSGCSSIDPEYSTFELTKRYSGWSMERYDSTQPAAEEEVENVLVSATEETEPAGTLELALLPFGFLFSVAADIIILPATFTADVFYTFDSWVYSGGYQP